MNAGAWYTDSSLLLDRLRESRPAYSLPSLDGFDELRELRRGGQAVIFEARQRSTGRRVALKVVHPSTGSRLEDQARVRREIRILAALNHPGIVAVHEGGTTPDGALFFAMDYIDGVPLDAWVESRRDQPRTILALFAAIADAVHAAHLRGIIHRDLKPSNILIDAAGRPHVLDFGVSAILESGGGSDLPAVAGTVPVPPTAAGTGIPFAETGIPSTAGTGIPWAAGTGIPSGSSPERVTQTGQFIGTLPWAAPEQARTAPELVDLRTDVYALGVMLYHALTGAFPYDVTGELPAILDRIMNAEPRAFAKRRGPDTEIETIVRKCLAKDPARRYQSAGDLARDIERYLAGEAIEARRDSRWYVLRKVLRRYRGPVAVATTFLLLTLCATVVSTVFWQRAETEAENARQHAIRAEASEARAGEEAARADREARDARQQAAKVEQVGKFLREMLAAIDPATAQTRDTALLRQVLDQAAARIETELADQPGAQAEISTTIGQTYLALGLYDPAEVHLRKALDLIRTHFADEHQDLAASLNNLAELLHKKGEVTEADQLLREALALRKLLANDDLGVAQTLNNLAELLHDRGDYAGAEPLFREALAIRRSLLGNEHPFVASSLNNLATFLQSKGDYAAAEPLLREALAMWRRLLGDEHPDVATCLNNLAALLDEKSDFAAAEPLLRESLAMRRKLLGDQHPAVATCLNNLAVLLERKADYAAAEPLYREALAIQRKLFGDEHQSVAITMHNLAATLHKKGDYAAAEPLFREALAKLRKSLGQEHPIVATCLGNLAWLLEDKSEYAAAEPLYREALAMRRKLLGDEHPDVSRSMSSLASLLQLNGDDAAAEPLLRELVERRRNGTPENQPLFASTLAQLGDCLLRLSRFADAEPLLRECLTIREKVLQPGSPGYWLRFNSQSMLGAALAGQGKFDQAEPLLLESYEKMEPPPGPIGGKRRREALERIVKLYESWDAAEPDEGHAVQAGRWRETLDRSISE